MTNLEILSVADRIALTLEGLCKAVAARIAPGIAGWAMQASVIVLVWTRIRRIDGRIRALLVRFSEGRLRTRVGVSVGGRAGGRRPGGGSSGLPLRFGWLIQMVPYQAAGYASQLRATLGQPEMEALLRASPQARRILAPLCRMLGVEAALLTPADAPPPSEDLPEVADAGLEQTPTVGWVREAPRVVRGDDGWRFAYPIFDTG